MRLKRAAQEMEAGAHEAHLGAEAGSRGPESKEPQGLEREGWERPSGGCSCQHATRESREYPRSRSGTVGMGYN